jgi:hypothetical protein
MIFMHSEHANLANEFVVFSAKEVEILCLVNRAIIDICYSGKMP